MVSSLAGLFGIETKRYLRNAHNFITPAVFTTLIALIAALGTTQIPQPDSLLWICAILAFLLNTDQLFRQDYHNGLLEQYFFSSINPYFIVLIKTTVFALFNGLAFLCISLPVMVLFLQPEASQLGLFLLALFAVIPSLTMLVALGTSYALASSGGFMPALITIPFYIPLVLLAMLAANNPLYYISLLVALALLYVALLSLAIQFILRNLAAA